jgi:hypothetical protein
VNPFGVSGVDCPVPSQHDKTTYENPWQVVPVAPFTGTTRVTMASLSSFVDTARIELVGDLCWG